MDASGRPGASVFRPVAAHRSPIRQAVKVDPRHVSSPHRASTSRENPTKFRSSSNRKPKVSNAERM